MINKILNFLKKKKCSCHKWECIIVRDGGFEKTYYRCLNCGKLTEETIIYDYNGELVQKIVKQIQREKKLKRLLR